MYIIQIADLHFGAKERDEDEIINSFINAVKAIVPQEDELLLCVCGDIVDSSQDRDLEPVERKQKAKKNYEVAKNYFKKIEKELKNIKIRFCVGNHDVSHKDEYINFVKEFHTEMDCDKFIIDTYVNDNENTAFIFINSCNENKGKLNYKKGIIDYDKLEEIFETLDINQKKILVIHHTVMSMDGEDESAIMDAKRLVTLLDKYHVTAVLHGHVHGRDLITMGKYNTLILGVGALISRNNADVNSQFNVIKYRKGFIESVNNYRYSTDNITDQIPWTPNSVELLKKKAFISGNEFKQVYEELDNMLLISPICYNVVINITNTFEGFQKTLMEFLEGDGLPDDNKKYSFFELAKYWEAKEVPSQLYFNHGMYFNEDIGCEGHVKFVVDELRNKPTSNSNVLQTYSMKNISNVRKGDDRYLPSLESIQFSLDDNSDVIYVHMHLRALESSRFLKINICEILWFLEEIKKKSIRFSNVDITISAFRVQKKSNFGCFLKCELDSISATKISRFVSKNNWEKICVLLEEKKKMTQTVIDVTGIDYLIAAMKEEEEENTSPTIKKINQDLFCLKGIYRELSEIQKDSSVRKKEEEYEKNIQKKIEEIICLYKELEKENS